MSVSSRSPGEEFRLAVSGPAINIAVIAVCSVAAGSLAVAWPSDATAPVAVSWILFVAIWVGLYNGFVVGVSLIPGYPFDGGRIVHAIAWRLTGSNDRAVSLTGRFCRYAGMALLGFGLLIATFGFLYAGLMMLIVGGQMLGSAGMVERRGVLQNLIAPLRAGEAAESGQPRVSAQLTLDVFAGAYLGEGSGNVALVERGDEVVGLIGAGQLKKIPRARWTTTRTEQAMAPIAGIPTISEDASLWSAIELLDRTGLDAILVALADGARAVLTRRAAATLVQERARQEGMADMVSGRSRRRFRGR